MQSAKANLNVELNVNNISKSKILSICPTGYEDFFSLKAHVEPLENNETWRRDGKRRKPMCK